VAKEAGADHLEIERRPAALDQDKPPWWPWHRWIASSSPSRETRTGWMGFYGMYSAVKWWWSG